MSSERIINVESVVLKKLHSLPAAKKREVLDFIEFLQKRVPVKRTRTLQGLWRDLGHDITEKDITEMRKDMLLEFPRKDF